MIHMSEMFSLVEIRSDVSRFVSDLGRCAAETCLLRRNARHSSGDTSVRVISCFLILFIVVAWLD